MPRCVRSFRSAFHDVITGIGTGTETSTARQEVSILDPLDQLHRVVSKMNNWYENHAALMGVGQGEHVLLYAASKLVLCKLSIA